MSVFERYQEIGVLKSMGALPRDIFRMILIETVILCAFGGIAGIALAYGFAEASEIAVRHFLPFAPAGALIEIDGGLALLAFVAITLTGVFGGIYPALRAAYIRPLDSIRSDA